MGECSNMNELFAHSNDSIWTPENTLDLPTRGLQTRAACGAMFRLRR